ncbi:hypothetical protein B0T20DRAFT_438296 [Sordaria brevicollis]|uniref:Trichothecene 3-O-acetyltransferase n=1 Tax=Sordaria brevicollis TaxID=83679 RepID=A0AAE0UCB3_SORBR|nr:hypothetical protein B0T20DRAFT_438296 [Sordaria brevicollis]
MSNNANPNAITGNTNNKGNGNTTVDKSTITGNLVNNTNTAASSSATTLPNASAILTTTTPLSPFNQIAPRVYTPRALCFPLSPHANHNPLLAHHHLTSVLSDRLKRIVNLRPSLGGKLQLGINLSDHDRSTLRQQGKYNDWHVYLQTSANKEGEGRDKIPLVVQYPEEGLKKHDTEKFFGCDLEAVRGWPGRYFDYKQLRRDEFPVEPFVNPQLTDLRQLKEGGEALPVVMVKVLFLKGGFILNVLGHHSFFDGGAFTRFLEVLAGMMRVGEGEAMTGLGLNRTFPSGHDLALSLPKMENKSYEELLALCPEYKEWEGKAKNGPTHPVCDKLPGREGQVSKGSSRIFVFTFAKIAQLSNDIKTKHNVKAGIYECLSGLLWCLTYYARFSVANDSTRHPKADFERFLHKHFSTAQPVFSTPTDWIARVAASKASDSFKAQIASETANYLGNKITWISTRTVSSNLLHVAALDLGLGSSLGNLSQVISAIAKSSTDVGNNVEQFLTVRHNLFSALSNSSSEENVDIRQIGLSFDPRQPTEWQMNSWKNFGADTEWGFPAMFCKNCQGMKPIVPLNACRGSSQEVNVTKPDAVRRVQAKYGVSGGLWLPARKEDKKEMFVQISLPEEVMEVFVKVVGKWVERVI